MRRCKIFRVDRLHADDFSLWFDFFCVMAGVSWNVYGNWDWSFMICYVYAFRGMV